MPTSFKAAGNDETASVSKMLDFPRSAYDQVGGIVYFVRMLHKIRLHVAGELRADYHADFDGRCCRFLGVTYEAVRAQTTQQSDDDAVLRWCFAHGTKPTDEQILVWNKFMLKRGWRDEDDGSTAELEEYKAGSGLSHRSDLLTFFDYYEVDEGRRP